MKWLKENWQGIGAALIIALIADYLGAWFPIIGAPVFGIVLGMITTGFIKKTEGLIPGLKFTGKIILQWAIIALGAGLSLTQVYRVGISSLYVMVFTLLGAFIAAYGFGYMMKIPLKLTSLIGMGTAICGGSAIAAISPIIEAEDQEIAYAISTVFIFNIIAVLIFPPLGHLLRFSDKAFGLWAGTAINDTSSVVASGYAYSDEAGAYATIVKLTRTTMIIPISLIFAVVVAAFKKKSAGEGGAVNFSLGKVFPWFVLGFLGMALFNTLGIIQGQAVNVITGLGKFMIVLALSAIGLNSDFKKMRATGLKPVLLGLIVWFVVAVISLIVQFTLGQI